MNLFKRISKRQAISAVRAHQGDSALALRARPSRSHRTWIVTEPSVRTGQWWEVDFNGGQVFPRGQRRRH